MLHEEMYDNHGPYTYCGSAAKYLKPWRGPYGSVGKKHKVMLFHLVDGVRLAHPSLCTDFTVKW